MLISFYITNAWWLHDKNTQSGCDEVAIQEIQNHIPDQSNAFQMV